MGLRIVIIGGVATGPKAAARARRLDKDAQITIIEQGGFLSYAGRGIPNYNSGLVSEYTKLISTSLGVLRDAAFFKAIKNVKVLTGTHADSIDRSAKTVHTTNLSTCAVEVIPYDKLVIATGSRPALPPVPGLDLKNVHTLKNIEDAQAVKAFLESGKTKKLAIIGGGMIGIQLAEAYSTTRRDNIEITIFEVKDNILPGLLDTDMAFLVEKRLRAGGVNLFLSEKVLRLEGDEGFVKKVVTQNGTFEADLIVVSAGVRPNVELAEKAGLALGPNGAILVNDRLQTSDPDIYAGGDCAESINIVSAQHVYAPMWSMANRQGRVIGNNVTGREDRFLGTAATSILKMFDYTVARTGLTEKEAVKLGFEPVSIIVAESDRELYIKQSNYIIIKLLACRRTRKVLGAQIVGPGDANKRIDVLACAITLGATVDQLASLDLAYAPTFSTAIDPLAHAANSLRNKMAGLANSISPLEVKEKIDRNDNLIFLDVRSPREFQDVGLPYMIFLDVRSSKEFQDVGLPYMKTFLIPLDQLRERTGELSREKEIIIFCKNGLRSYEAQLILQEHGFQNAKFMEGGLSAWPFELEHSHQELNGKKHNS
ncbi:MAG TPA: pyridine nucleotide-disulfide oxidoreductase [Desulfotomaculum sp.]|nr:pyridine nucleotide-disulfide oxidoreductase [Desulfotomaculum sp.]